MSGGVEFLLICFQSLLGTYHFILYDKEKIKCLLGDTNFLFSCFKMFDSKRNFVSRRGLIIIDNDLPLDSLVYLSKT